MWSSAGASVKCGGRWGGGRGPLTEVNTDPRLPPRPGGFAVELLTFAETAKTTAKRKPLNFKRDKT